MAWDNELNLPKIHLDFNPVANRIMSNSQCSAAQNEMIRDGIEKFKPWVEKTMLENDPVLFHKWFGTVHDGGLSDEQVKHRMQRTYDFLYEDEPRWDVMCCNEAIGGCTGCQGNALGYVTSKFDYATRTSDGQLIKFTDSEHNNIHIRLCPRAFEVEDPVATMGIIMYHEVNHIVTHTVDHCYNKDDCYHLAQSEPEKARLNAHTYTLHAIEGGADREDYAEYTKSWGGMIVNDQCSDYYSNCWTHIQNKTCTEHADLIELCCASCHHQQGMAPDQNQAPTP